jgi:SAM-dependent methyltransferase
MLSALLGADTLPMPADVLHVGGGDHTGRMLAHAFPKWAITTAQVPSYRTDKADAGAGSDPPGLPYPDAIFDLVVGGPLRQRLGDWRALTTPVHRILRPSGMLALTGLVPPALIGVRASTPAHLPDLVELQIALAVDEFHHIHCTELAGLCYRILARR